MIPEPCNTHNILYARWSTFSGRFHTVSFTMQSHDQYSTSSLNRYGRAYLGCYASCMRGNDIRPFHLDWLMEHVNALNCSRFPHYQSDWESKETHKEGLQEEELFASTSVNNLDVYKELNSRVYLFWTTYIKHFWIKIISHVPLFGCTTHAPVKIVSWSMAKFPTPTMDPTLHLPVNLNLTLTLT